MKPILIQVIKGASIVDTQPVKWSLLATSISKRHHAHMLTAVSHTGVSRLRRVRMGQGGLLDHVFPGNNHGDKIFEKNAG